MMLNNGINMMIKVKIVILIKIKDINKNIRNNNINT